MDLVHVPVSGTGPGSSNTDWSFVERRWSGHVLNDQPRRAVGRNEAGSKMGGAE